MKPLAEPCNEHQKKRGEKSPGEMMASEAVPAANTEEVGAGGDRRNTALYILIYILE